ncbi:hypothetical protein pb186bvf_016961 [Paramecium bursaria]
MNILKKITKRKKNLKQQVKPQIDIVHSISLTDSLYISGDFYFVHLNCDILIDQYIIKEVGINHFKSDKPLQFTQCKSEFPNQEFLNRFQKSQIEDQVIYQHFFDKMIKDQNDQPHILIYGFYKTHEQGIIVSEQKQEFYDKEYKSVLILGDKGSGKTTTLLQYSNILLNKSIVYILDCDLGQSIFLPGFINLMKLNKPLFLQEAQVIYQGFVGEFAIQNNISQFLYHLSEAYSNYNQCQLLRDFPLLINTPGHVSNYGITILQEIINTIQPQITLILAQYIFPQQVKRAEALMYSLPQESFISQTQTAKTQYKLLVDDSQYTEQQLEEINHNMKPQQRKLNRYNKIAQNLGLINLNYLTLCNSDQKEILIQDCTFSIGAQNFEDIISIGRVFCLNLVAIYNQQQVFLGLGYIADVDQTKVYIITMVDICQKLIITKSKHYEISHDQYGDLSIDDYTEFIDQNSIQIQQNIQFPFLQLKQDRLHKQSSINRRQF